jgi:hypothetical protein
MDGELATAWRAHIFDPCPRHEAIFHRAVERVFHAPDDRFQADLRKGGRLERALAWEMELPRLSVECWDEGGKVSASSSGGHNTTHIRIWYPTLKQVYADLSFEDVRIVVRAPSRLVGDVIESLEDNFPSATVVSNLVAEAQPDEHVWSSNWTKPKRREDIDHNVLASTVGMEGSQRSKGWGHSPWVS